MTQAQVKSLDELLRQHSLALAAKRVEDDPATRAWHLAKRVVWMFLLAAAFLFYYLLDKMSEALSLL